MSYLRSSLTVAQQLCIIAADLQPDMKKQMPIDVARISDMASRLNFAARAD